MSFPYVCICPLFMFWFIYCTVHHQLRNFFLVWSIHLFLSTHVRPFPSLPTGSSHINLWLGSHTVWPPTDLLFVHSHSPGLHVSGTPPTQESCRLLTWPLLVNFPCTIRESPGPSWSNTYRSICHQSLSYNKPVSTLQWPPEPRLLTEWDWIQHFHDEVDETFLTGHTTRSCLRPSGWPFDTAIRSTLYCHRVWFHLPLLHRSSVV